MSLPPVHHITFCTRAFAGPAHDLRKSARTWGLETRFYTPRDAVVRRLAAAHPAILGQERGAGYWLWKPAIILDALSSIAEGDLVFYTDAGINFTSDPAALLRQAAEAPVTLFEHRSDLNAAPEYVQREWTKRDCFVLLDADRPEFWNAPQLMAGVQVYRNCAEARSFVTEWFDAATDARILTDAPNTMGLANLDGFREHRHDQSILTILAIKHGIRALPYPGEDTPSRPRVLNVHRRQYSRLQATRIVGPLVTKLDPIRRVVRPRQRLRRLLAMLLRRNR